MNTRKTTYDYLHMLLMLMACLIVTACNDDDDWQEPAEYLNISIYSPQTETRAITRAGTDTHDPVKAETEENTIHDVYVWAFLSTSNSGTSDTDKPIGYVAGNINAASGNIQMPITEDNLNKLLASDGKVDFYVIANTTNMKSLSLPSKYKTATRKQVRDAYFGVNNNADDFGGSSATNADTWYTDNLSGSGLPSANTTTEDVVTDSNELTKGMISIELLRAVSRLRFVFSRATDLEDVEIEKIEISGSGIYKQEKLFYTSEETTSLTGYTETWAITHDFTKSTTSTTPNPYTDLKSLERKYDATKQAYTETAQEYETRIDKAISDDNASEYGRTYIRETNAPLTATITFRCEQTTLKKTVTLSDTNKSTNYLPRNHTWLVYGYFEKGSLQLTANVQEWDLVDGTVNYKDGDIVSVTDPLVWTTGTYGTVDNKSNQLKFITDENGGEAIIEGTFTFDAPRPAVWYASLIHQEGNEDAIQFVIDDNGHTASTVSGPVGKKATIKIKAVNDKTTVQNRVQLKFSIRRTLNNENVKVEDKTICGNNNGPYYIYQIKNDF